MKLKKKCSVNVKIKRVMIRFRQKEFGNLQDGYLGKLGEIKKIGLRRDAHYNYKGPWNIVWGEVASDDYSNVDDYFTPEDIKRINKIEEWIKKHPFGKDNNEYNQHPLWEFVDQTHETEIWSANINEKDRLIYLISKVKNHILIINCREHFVTNIPYSLNKIK